MQIPVNYDFPKFDDKCTKDRTPGPESILFASASLITSAADDRCREHSLYAGYQLRLHMKIAWEGFIVTCTMLSAQLRGTASIHVISLLLCTELQNALPDASRSSNTPPCKESDKKLFPSWFPTNSSNPRSYSGRTSISIDVCWWWNSTGGRDR